jgi:hypothetical protein
MADTFLDPNEAALDAAERRRRQIVRECRGITFDSTSGKVIARKLHKFRSPDLMVVSVSLIRHQFVFQAQLGSGE